MRPAVAEAEVRAAAPTSRDKWAQMKVDVAAKMEDAKAKRRYANKLAQAAVS